MKIRQGFVSNSSSSSFICLVCGDVDAGYDLSMEDAQFCECTNGHEFCDHHLIGDFDYETDDRYEMDPSKCPICTMTHIRGDDVLRYLHYMNIVDIDLIITQIKRKYNNDYPSFDSDMKEIEEMKK